MKKRLYRIESGKMLAGVCGGIAEYFDIDPTLVRALWVLFCILGGSGILLYIILAVLIPVKTACLDRLQTRSFLPAGNPSGTEARPLLRTSSVAGRSFCHNQFASDLALIGTIIMAFMQNQITKQQTVIFQVNGGRAPFAAW